ncbi:MAG: proline--tRNA ligase [Chloroflexi bacterium]|jgi:prolyl-tRNA synthetase|uniref:Proline--tRNA ligase n=1 Tax=Candidatus Thermofonsia Clade 3 bacterium TaxID=2364212 RepID=A0A2M8QBP1_9CHLR|nr:proline--tRNA ligase [Candidatus Roseilinea sp. NK_OTU-006]PJF47216.1 MAG: proline--tRNA ligase [Candidatus Thermofonsia Clade 3 bacterium]RMG62463.1 MAG: proline--tRNA ligase [Chloroflexota bacterium]
MRLSSLLGATLREAPAGAEPAGQRLLLRAGFIRPLGAGLFAYLPLAHRTLTRIEGVLREELAAIGGQEMRLSAVLPAEMINTTDGEAARFSDRKARDLALGTSWEAAIAEIVRKEIRAHRQLPQLLFHIQPQFRDAPRPRAGLLDAREFTALEALGVCADAASAQAQAEALREAWQRAFRRCALPVRLVEAGADGAIAHRFVYLTPEGEDEIVVCDGCGYAADRRTATFRKPPAEAEPLRPMEKVATPDAKTIEALARCLNIPKRRTAKAVFLVAAHRAAEGRQARFVFVVIRGDLEVSAAKLAAALGASELRPATEDEIRAIGAAPGYASPIGLAERIRRAPWPAVVVVDDSVPASPNLVAGANEVGYHLLNTNYGRDYVADIVADIAAPGAGDACPRCSAPLHLTHGVAVGHMRRLGAQRAETHPTYLAGDGRSRPILMLSAGVNISRWMACIAEQHHDDRGLIWPPSVAPYSVHLVALAGRDGDALAQAEALYQALQRAGVETLFDDRAESPGVKFADADLIGLPLRVTVAPKSLAAGGAELKRRDADVREIAPLGEVVQRAQAMLNRMAAEVQAGAWRAQTNAE